MGVEAPAQCVTTGEQCSSNCGCCKRKRLLLLNGERGVIFKHTCRRFKEGGIDTSGIPAHVIVAEDCCGRLLRKIIFVFCLYLRRVTPWTMSA